MILTRDQILSAQDHKIERVPVPEWGGEVCVTTMKAGERDRWELGIQGKTIADIRASLLHLTLCDEKGERLFSADDIQALSEKASAPIQRLFDASVKLNRVSKEDVKELEKN